MSKIQRNSSDTTVSVLPHYSVSKPNNVGS